jgi:hypothetical protein
MASEQAIAAAGLAGTFGIGAREGGIRWDDAAQQAAYDAAERATRTTTTSGRGTTTLTRTPETTCMASLSLLRIGRA